MSRADDIPIDPEIAAELEVIDATLAGEPVPPAHAELAELALLLADERPRPEAEFVRRLDDRASVRFGPRGIAAADEEIGVARIRPAARRGRSPWRLGGVVGALAAGALAVAVAVVIVGSAGSGPSTSPLRLPEARTASSSPRATANPPASPAPGAAAVSPDSSSTAASGAGGGAVVQPFPNGRKIVQSAQLSLNTAPAHVDDVAQEVFDAVGLAGGIVKSSTVTASSGSDSYAEFELAIPSSALGRTMAALSKLRYASVASRTDTSQDVNDEYQATVRRLIDAQAVRIALLRRLAGATTAQEIASVKAQIRTAEASIASAQSALRTLNQRIAYSPVALSINASPGTPVPVPASHGFTIGRALHDAARVLAVAAGVAIVALAVLVPVALVAALGLWIAALVRRHRREHALDLA